MSNAQESKAGDYDQGRIERGDDLALALTVLDIAASRILALLNIHAGMAKLADAGDLKSLDP